MTAERKTYSANGTEVDHTRVDRVFDSASYRWRTHERTSPCRAIRRAASLLVNPPDQRRFSRKRRSQQMTNAAAHASRMVAALSTVAPFRNTSFDG
jgi:hypothetical protein